MNTLLEIFSEIVDGNYGSFLVLQYKGNTDAKNCGFSLSKDGETLELSTRDSQTVEDVEINFLLADESKIKKVLVDGVERNDPDFGVFFKFNIMVIEDLTV